MGEPIFLSGAAGAVGTVQGHCQRLALAERVGRTFGRAAASGTASVLHARAGTFAALLAQAAPHWLEEAEALAAAAKIEPWQLLALNCLPGDFWGAAYPQAAYEESTASELVDVYEAQGVDPGLGGGDCTTLLALGSASLSGETILHKNRDERDEVQWLGAKQIGGHFRFVGAAEIGNLGTAHSHTENFWAGANNTGPEIGQDEYIDCALSDSHVLRLLCESCRTLDDIVPALQAWQAQGLVGGGGNLRGSIWVFADASRGLVVEATSRRLAFAWLDDGDMAVRTNHFLLPEMLPHAKRIAPGSAARLKRASELWEAQQGMAGISLAAEIGRDREGAPSAICRNPSDGLGSVTVSTSTATISRHDDRRCQTHFRNCHPAYTPVVILSPIDIVSDSDLISGAHNQHWRKYRDGA